MMADHQVYYVGTPDEVTHHARPLVDAIGAKVIPANDVERLARPGDLCIFFNEYFPHYREACRQARERGCPTLYAIDGILEWRNSWESPEQLSCPWTMRPVLSQKVACIGRSQARVLESWGNLGNCEVVGLPRLDTLLGRAPRRRAANETCKILVMTAKNPGFTPEQVARVEQSLTDLKNWFERNSGSGGNGGSFALGMQGGMGGLSALGMQPVWRLTGGLAERIGLTNTLANTSGADLAAALAEVDAVVTTPSTAMLEAMLCGLPVALLDYNNCPHYVPSAWTISSQEQIAPVLSELASPSPAKMVFQDSVLHDALECLSPATPRMVRLAEEMIRIAHDCRAAGTELRLPDRILPDQAAGHHLPEQRFDLQKLYPNHPVFSDMDRAALQAEVANLRVVVRKQDEIIRLLRSPVWRGTVRPKLGAVVYGVRSWAASQLKRLAKSNTLDRSLTKHSAEPRTSEK